MNKHKKLVCHKPPHPRLGHNTCAGSDEEGGDTEDSAGHCQEEACRVGNCSSRCQQKSVALHVLLEGEPCIEGDLAGDA